MTGQLKESEPQPYLLSLEGVRLSRQPVNTVTVQAAGQAAVSRAAHLHSHVAHALHHAAGEAAASAGGDGLNLLARHQEERGDKEGEEDEHSDRLVREKMWWSFCFR